MIDPNEALSQMRPEQSAGHPLLTGAAVGGAVIAANAYRQHQDAQQMAALQAQIAQQVINEQGAAAYGSPQQGYEINQRVQAASAQLAAQQAAKHRHNVHVGVVVGLVALLGLILMCLPL